jgi:hypothetical protein
MIEDAGLVAQHNPPGQGVRLSFRRKATYVAHA